MGKDSKIAWTDHTFNPWWGCTKVSDGCAHCYAKGVASRFAPGHWGPDAPRRFFGDKHWAEPLAWDKAAQRRGVRERVFCGSMCDVFEDRSELDRQRARLWELVDRTPSLDWLLLTKRPSHIALPWGVHSNVWLGTTVENQAAADERIPRLVTVGARLHFLSCEPLLGPVRPDLCHVDWVICGAESGSWARLMDLDWVRSLRDQCQSAGVPFFFKQDIVGGRKVEMPELDGKVWAEVPGGEDYDT